MTVTVTCTTEGCENSGHPIAVQAPVDEQGRLDPTWIGVFCGPCGSYIQVPAS